MSLCYTKSDELYHHGIKGQKWGVRRFQNEDGSLTDAGRKRYGKEVYKIIKKHGVSGINVGKELSNSRIAKDIINDPEYVKSKNAYKNAIKYEQIAMDYDPFEDNEALSAMAKAYKKRFWSRT